MVFKTVIKKERLGIARQLLLSGFEKKDLFFPLDKVTAEINLQFRKQPLHEKPNTVQNLFL